jgi:ORF6N domain-containing protein
MSKEIIPIEHIARAILILRGQKALLDFDLAILYGVSTKVLNQAVKRNQDRFPEDFMFQLSVKETRSLRSQFVTLNEQTAQTQRAAKNRSQFVTGSLKHRERKSPPYAFTEQGVAMLSSVLNSERAVRVNIAIMRAFVKLREMLETNRELARKFSELEKRVGKHDSEIVAILEAIRQLMAPAEKPRREIGFHAREKSTRYRSGNGR